MIIVLNESLVECGNEEITKELLNLIIDDEIKEVKLDYKEVLDKDILSDKAGILDIKAKLNDKIWCDIEMQVVDEKNIEKRILYYWSKLFSSQLQSGENYGILQKTVIVLITNYEIPNLKNIESTLTKWKVREDNANAILTTDLEFYILEMPKLKKYNDLNETLKKWVKFINNPEELSMEDYEENENLKKAKSNLYEFNAEQEEYINAARRIMAIADKQAIEEAGFDKGLEAKKIEIAKNMLKDNVDIKIISKYTGLSIEEIEKLKQSFI